MTRICHVIGDSEFGGGSKVILQLAECALEDGYEVSIVATDGEFVSHVERSGATAVELDCVRRSVNPFFDLLGLVRLVRHFRSERYDLVQTHTSKGGIIGRLAATLARVPAIVHTVHGFAFHEASGRLARSVYSMLERLAARWCHRIVTVSRHHRELALRFGIGDAAKVVAIPNGIEAPPTSPHFDRGEARKRLGAGDDDVLALGLGRLAKQKGFAFLIDAVARLRDEGVSCRCMIAGEGPLRSELERRIRAASLEDRVELLGFRSDIGDLYEAADLVVQPSLWEGLSISLLEAMALGRPIVSTTIHSNMEVVGDSEAAVLVPASDGEAFARAMKVMIESEARRAESGAAARRLFEEGYTVDAMLDAYRRLYEKLLNRR